MNINKRSQLNGNLQEEVLIYETRVFKYRE